MSVPQPSMMRFRKGFLCALWLIPALLLKPVQDRVDAHMAGRLPDEDVLYFNSPKIVEKLALGYDSLLADLYWMRAIQYYGRREEAERRPVRYKNLSNLLDITTTLDPDLLDAYRVGSSFLAEPDPLGAGQPEEALRLLDKGIAHNPYEWRLYFDKGFVYYWFLSQFKAAGETWIEASRLPEAPHWMEGLAAMALSQGGTMEPAKRLWQHQYQESDRADVRENAWNHLVSIRVAEDLWTLEFLCDRQRERTGKQPARLDELVQAGLLEAVPLDPSGTPYQYDPGTGKVRLSPGSTVRYLAVPEAYHEAYLKQLAGAGTGGEKK